MLRCFCGNNTYWIEPTPSLSFVVCVAVSIYPFSIPSLHSHNLQCQYFCISAVNMQNFIWRISAPPSIIHESISTIRHRKIFILACLLTKKKTFSRAHKATLLVTAVVGSWLNLPLTIYLCFEAASAIVQG